MQSGATIMVVDDDPGLLRLIERGLSRAAFEVVTASSGREAIDWLAKNTPDLLLLDLKLQDIEGKEVINHLTAINRLVPFIIITGQGDERVAVEMMKRGAIDYVVKDVAFLEFVPEIARRAVKQITQEKELATALAEREELEKALLEISEREQTRIGQDLHDGLGQHLAGIELLTQVLEQKLADKKMKAEAARAGELAAHVREAISQTRMLARGLSAFVVQVEGLEAALRQLAASSEQLFRIECKVETDAAILVGDSAVATHLYRIAQEAISNAVRHGKATEVRVELRGARDATILRISDNGLGLRENATDRKGMGLRTMQYRAGIAGGTLTIQNGPAGGTIVTCALPK